MAQYITLLLYIKVIQSWPDLLHFRYLVIQRTSWSKNRPMLYLIGQNSCLTNSNSTSTLTLVCVSFFLTHRPVIHFPFWIGLKLFSRNSPPEMIITLEMTIFCPLVDKLYDVINVSDYYYFYWLNSHSLLFLEEDAVDLDGKLNRPKQKGCKQNQPRYVTRSIVYHPVLIFERPPLPIPSAFIVKTPSFHQALYTYFVE